jgi:hypothetical protein
LHGGADALEAYENSFKIPKTNHNVPLLQLEQFVIN